MLQKAWKTAERSTNAFFPKKISTFYPQSGSKKSVKKSIDYVSVSRHWGEPRPCRPVLKSCKRPEILRDQLIMILANM